MYNVCFQNTWKTIQFNYKVFKKNKIVILERIFIVIFVLPLK